MQFLDPDFSAFIAGMKKSNVPIDADTAKLPAIFLTHGGGPCVQTSFAAPFGPDALDGLRGYVETMLVSLPQSPKAIVIISGHWESRSYYL